MRNRRKRSTYTLATVTTAIGALETTEAAAVARTRGAATARNEKSKALATLLEQLKAYVQQIADANTDTSAAVIQSAGMALRKPVLRQKQVFGVTLGPVSGSVKLTAEAAARRASYEWQYSPDGKTWQQLPSTLQSKTTMTGLIPGATANFRYRAVTKAGEGDWSQPVTLIVK